jgi:tRNA nucleotidyltransferase (CCA-adding enzyme)
MNGNQYLQDLLASQELTEGCAEVLALDKERDEVERLLRGKYPYSNLTFTHGGSRAKGTMIRDDYDLDEVTYFDNEDTSAGETLEEIYESIATLLEKSYTVRRKRSALRLRSADNKKDFKVDVVPGRYIDDTRTDVFLHQNEGDKERLKTNLEVHIRHIRDSGCTDVIKLAKLWRTRNDIHMKTFPL